VDVIFDVAFDVCRSCVARCVVCRVTEPPRFLRQHQRKELVRRLVQGKPVMWEVLWLQNRLVAFAIANQLQA
jgi:hypothetical protein